MSGPGPNGAGHGKSRSTIDPELARELGLTVGRRGAEIPNLRLGSHVFRIPSAKLVRLGGIDPDLEDPIQVGVGSDILGRIVFTVDRSDRKIWFGACGSG